MRKFQLPLAAALVALALVAVGCGDDDDSADTDTGGGGASAETTGGGGAGYGGGEEKADTTGGGAAGGGAETLKIAADPGGALAFDTDALDAKAGKVTIVMDNPSDLPHAVSIEGNGVDADGNTVEKGGVSKVSAELEPGEYTFYCPVDGHEAAGMKGTLTVK